MRGKSCSSESQNNSPHLSGAYIRSLVKQLTSSKSTKDLSDSSENSGPADGVSDKQGKARQAKNRAAMKQAREKQQLELELEQDFENLDTTAFHNPSSNFSSSSPSTSSSPALSAATEEIPHTLQARTNGDSGLHFGDDQWNADSVNSEECWFKFLNSMEIGPEEQKDEDLVSSPFDEVMEFPAWLNANESFSQHVNDFCSDDSVQDLALPCMDIQEIEGMDGDWLA
ncbi:UNVERIFIED_CONTAM: hypothetical protein Slati_1878700 [Sesamum latifolium]|uniref:BZIP domain-containing protein n=1 Tax=Sesamum latifolium TaxID=2727402 RepID=A0AAW2X129_9LAMI